MATYTEEDIRVMARAFAREKKKASQVDALKRLLTVVKQKSDTLLASRLELEEENQLLGQQINSLKTSLAKEETAELSELKTHQSLLEQELELEAERQNLLKLELDREKEAHQERKKHAEQLERVIQFLRERSEGPQVELQLLQKELETFQNDFKNADALLKEARNENTALQNSLKGLKSQEAHLEFFKGEVARIKQTLLRAVRESQELQAHHQAIVAEKVGLIGKWRQTQHQLKKERENFEQLQEKLEKATSLQNQWQQKCVEDERKAAAQIAQEAEKIVSQAQLIQQREETIHDLQLQVGLLRHEGEKARDALSDISSTIAAKEHELHEAQQHLARKVKEVAEMELQCEAKDQRVAQLQEVHQADKIRIAELEASCEMHLAQQNRMQELQAKGEDKYMALYDKCQAAEGRIKELEKLEERYNQLQGLFANVGNVLNVPSKPIEPVAKEEKIEPPKPFSNLFELPKTAQRPKQTLL